MTTGKVYAGYKFRNPETEKLIRSLYISEEDADREIAARIEEKMQDAPRYIYFADVVGSDYEAVGVYTSSFKKVARREYNPNGWNPYPEVTPPRCDCYFVQYENGSVDMSEWSQNGWCDVENIIAFRAFPEKYKPEEE